MVGRGAAEGREMQSAAHFDSQVFAREEIGCGALALQAYAALHGDEGRKRRGKGKGGWLPGGGEGDGGEVVDRPAGWPTCY